MKRYVVRFSEIGKEDISLVGGKGANLGEMVKLGIPVPDGFIVTATAYFDFLSAAKLSPGIREALLKLDPNDDQNLHRVAGLIKKEILTANMPPKIASEIGEAYKKLGRKSFVAVRSSATAEDLPGASFAGQQRTFLNVSYEKQVVEAVQKCWASLFEPRAIFYRAQKGFNHLKVGIAVPVQKMVQSDVSGVMFTIDPVQNDKEKIVIEAIFGLGELVVSGRVTPDRYVVDKRTEKIEKKEILPQKRQLVKVGRKNKEIAVSFAWQNKQKLADDQIIQLALLGKKIERHYYFPQDIEWAVENGRVYILQTRPVTTLGTLEKEKLERRKLEVLLIGSAASPGIGTGPVKVLKSPKQIHRVKPGDVLVAEMTSPDFVPAMRKAAAIVTDKGGLTSHAAIVSRELGLPCVVGTKKATALLKSGQIVTVSGTEGRIYKGGRKPKASKIEAEPGPIKAQKPVAPLLAQSPKTATKIYVNLGQPELAAKVARENVDGVGLLRAEFMVAEIGVHPKELILEKREKAFVEKLVAGLLKFCQAFSPRPVIYRATDFKTNEYRNLKGGESFEPEETNPFLGYRGAFRYISDPKVFSLELEAIKVVRNKKKLKNLWLMLPFVRTVKELQEAKKIINAKNLRSSPSFKLWLMVEIPSNVICLEDFLRVGIDGVSIGSNDLTMLILGVDRDNPEVASAFDERDRAVLWAIERTIKTCQKQKVTSSICGQAPTVYPDLVEKLVGWGITSISVNPDAIESTRKIVYEAEKKLVKGLGLRG